MKKNTKRWSMLYELLDSGWLPEARGEKIVTVSGTVCGTVTVSTYTYNYC